jgi:phage repressor protein C with HTH and peptisase S24 domain
MLRHEDIWRAIDGLAAARGLTASGLARRAGLDATTFNKSKRVTRDGKPRWPSTESVSKILQATNSTLEEFVGYVTGKKTGRSIQRIPVLGCAQAGEHGFFDDAGYPVGSGWDEIMFPDMADPHAYALEVSGDSMEPVYRDGDLIIVSPAASLRRGDRVVVKTKDGEVMAKQLLRRTAQRVELQSLNPEHPDRSVPVEDLAWMARIVWASQ